ncbi:cytochrome c oxidase assembly protein [Rhodoplanes sp. TEM]|uniref:Cytochrome c oxidase assembly protein n=1 Tax=Rhodoplanes tepidamans TaxID=200616 RepID=A0ABT5JG86_RHOTP|nr:MULTISPECIES: cytochrome c oxidase assembly protein [Rhodoplanes]MDC7788314.1 cytochrome c oxidase assembly protein [Rhodoplanes tepidamans]MDC7986933.1 cytochrome c oxidase assembly protein [Rhodoplanes sp. TEM]MDQ0358795.1 cytochrome c oxidase assembly factor CtaG [Rhodoplanes tepidamans]
MSANQVLLAIVAAFAAGGAAGALVGSGPSLLALCLAGTVRIGPTDTPAWSLAPATLLPVVAGLVLYAVGVVQSHRHGRPVAAGRIALFAAGWSLVAVALVSPLCRLAAGLAWAHMVQHVVLVAFAPPLLLLGSAGVWRSAADRAPPLVPAALLRPGAAALLYGAAIWAWHVPRFYEAALRDGAVHLLMIGSLAAVSLLFWQAVLGSARRGPGAALAAAPTLLATLMHTGMLGALLVFSPGLWFPVMAQGALLSGMSPLEDQQLAGLIMWVPMGLVYMIAALALVARGIAAPLPAEPSRPA